MAASTGPIELHPDAENPSALTHHMDPSQNLLSMARSASVMAMPLPASAPTHQCAGSETWSILLLQWIADHIIVNMD